jgi:hypothetical protein
MTITEEFYTFKPGTKARALDYLKTGILRGDAHPSVQARLDRWFDRVERHGPTARARVLQKLEGGQ